MSLILFSWCTSSVGVVGDIGQEVGDDGLHNSAIERRRRLSQSSGGEGGDEIVEESMLSLLLLMVLLVVSILLIRVRRRLWDR